MRSYSLPSPIHFTILKSQFASLQARAINSGMPHYLTSIYFFLKLYQNVDEENLLCELYLHDLVLTRHNKWDPNHHVEDL